MSLVQTSKATDNSHLGLKLKVRQEAVQDLDEIKVLDCYAGRNVMWSHFKTDRYYGIEREKGKGKNLYADNLKVIPSLDLSGFNVIDLDAYGVPYEQVNSIFDNPTLQNGTKIIYTANVGGYTTPNKQCMVDFHLEKFFEQSTMLVKHLYIPLFFEMIRRHNVDFVREIIVDISGESITKYYGYFTVKC